jgi:predicted dehydrogenase
LSASATAASRGRKARRARAVGVGIVGLGYMGRMHVAAYRAAALAGFPNRIVAFADRAPTRRAGRTSGAARGGGGGRANLAVGGPDPLAGLADVPIHRDAAALLADDAIELVSICTPTETHVPLALAALAAGKHVVVEKPVALRARDVQRLATAAKKARRLCMPAMCMRFWPGWTWLKAAVDSGPYGRVRSAVFRRLAAPPAWSRGFYGDAEKCGGALFDLHVHDADFVRHLFGAPRALVSTGTADHVTTLYRYGPRGPAHVVAEGGWDHASGYPFFMGFTGVFGRATAEFALGRVPVLTLYRGGAAEGVALEPGTGYDGELRHALAVVTGRAQPRATIAEAVDLVRMLEAERKSLSSGRPVTLVKR